MTRAVLPKMREEKSEIVNISGGIRSRKSLLQRDKICRQRFDALQKEVAPLGIKVITVNQAVFALIGRDVRRMKR